jgi:dipeptidyl aminopeptidase/acylaminoacyl peptidase
MMIRIDRAPLSRRAAASGPLLALAVLLTHAAVASPLLAQGVIEQEGYLRPSPEIAAAVLAPHYLNVTLSNPSPDRRWFVKQQSEGLPTLASLARTSYNLGGLQIDPAANRARTMSVRGASGFELISWEDGRSVNVQLPGSVSVTTPQWSPDGSRLAFFGHTDNATHVYVADARTGRARRLTATPVLATLYTSLDWTADGRHVAAVLVPENRGPEPARPAVPSTPQVLITSDGNNRLRTYPSLLKDPHEMALVEYYTTGQLALIDASSGAVRRIGRPAMIRNIDVAPDAQHIRVTTMRRPFSYIVPVGNFPTAEEVWNTRGELMTLLSETPLRLGEQTGGAGGTDADPAGDAPMRNISWRPDGQGLGFLQLAPAPARPAGDTAAANGARRRDRVVQWLPPFDGNSMNIVYESDNRLTGLRYSEDGRILFLTERVGTANHEFAVYLDEPTRRHTISRVAADEFFANPGSLMTRRGARGSQVVQLSSDGAHVFLSGTQHFEDPARNAPRAFVDRVEIRTGTKTRIFEGENETIAEQILAVMDDDATRLIVSRESPTMIPDSYYRNMTTGAMRKLTDNRDYAPEITAAQRRRVQVTRADGVRMNVNVTLPADYRAGTRLPAMFWFYPREYTDQESYDRTLRTYNRNRFPSVGTRSMSILTRLGYAVVEPDAPIIGASGRMNDNYVNDLRNNLSAVIDELDRQAIIDRQRLGIGGHSYGAFSAVNAMVHTPFFRAGIAGNGAYNRTLTPLGFQSERRDFWEARETYLNMSPFLYANQMTGALLMYHGTEDQNVGTFPINSERLFQALNGLGKTAALYMYPYEDHGPVAQETLLDLWARWTAWLDLHLKQPEQPRVTTDENFEDAA